MTAVAAAGSTGTVVHRLPVWAKLLGLTVGCAVILVHPLAGLAVVVACYALARQGPRAAWAQVRPLRWFALVLFGTQVLIADLPTALTSVSRIVLAVLLAGLVTLTTSTSALLAGLERLFGPLRRLGVDPFRLSLVLSLTLRSVPIIADLAARVREAQRARGVRWDVRAFAVPLVVGVLRYADLLGEALTARGLDDPA
ncbi:energy-coupling factor transporter transmembrane protein EcfT [Nonomuraea sp. NPDC050310]|uniref:energy-coupling factor transporter transmembrane component T family protein n=1 Tax=Nonomuraea sp. NPDC050310 TaxID=3154935 RepID=UPI00340E51D9